MSHEREEAVLETAQTPEGTRPGKGEKALEELIRELPPELREEAEKYNLTLVSLDGDFDRTERGRKTPAEVLETL